MIAWMVLIILRERTTQDVSNHCAAHKKRDSSTVVGDKKNSPGKSLRCIVSQCQQRPPELLPVAIATHRRSKRRRRQRSGIVVRSRTAKLFVSLRGFWRSLGLALASKWLCSEEFWSPCWSCLIEPLSPAREKPLFWLGVRTYIILHLSSI